MRGRTYRTSIWSKVNERPYRIRHKNFNKQVGKTYYVLCPDDKRYFRSVYIRYNGFTQQIQSHSSTPVMGVPPEELEPISPIMLSRLMRAQLQSTFY